MSFTPSTDDEKEMFDACVEANLQLRVSLQDGDGIANTMFATGVLVGMVEMLALFTGRTEDAIRDAVTAAS